MPVAGTDVTLSTARVTSYQHVSPLIKGNPMPDLSESIRVSAPALSVYDLVSDLPRMGEWSPECTRVTWSSRTPGPAVGARFVGYNRVGAVRWFTQGRVVDAVPGQVFSFLIHFGPIPVSLWSYSFKTGGPGSGSSSSSSSGSGSGSGSSSGSGSGSGSSSGSGSGSGCEVTESWTDHRPAVFRLLFRPLFGDRTPRNVHGIHTTLQRLKSAAEASAGAPDPIPDDL
jgi:hypothetical protein